MFCDNGVEEFVSIEATPCWDRGKNVNKDIPDMYSVSLGMFAPTEINFDYIGEYKLDGKKETYDAAVKNFEKICEQLLTQGWVKENQFENFEWY